MEEARDPRTTGGPPSYPVGGVGCTSPARRLWGLLRAGAGGGGRGQTPAPRAPAPPSCGAGIGAMLHGKRIYRLVSCAGAEDTGRAQHPATPRPPPGVRERPQRPARPTYHAGAVDPRARCSPQLGLEPFSSQALRERARAGSAGRGRTGRHSSAGPRDRGKTRPDSPARREPSAQPGPRMWGAGTGTAPERPEPRPGSWVLRGRVPTASRARCSGYPGARSLARSLLRSLTCSSSADPGPDEALERAPPACSSSSSSSGPRPPHPVSFQNQLPNWLAGMGWFQTAASFSGKRHFPRLRLNPRGALRAEEV